MGLELYGYDRIDDVEKTKNKKQQIDKKWPLGDVLSSYLSIAPSHFSLLLSEWVTYSYERYAVLRPPPV